jgi:serine/threonine-protein phosphatase 6 regulatory subunit 3
MNWYFWLMVIRQDLFFEFPWNNLLHATVYDVVHQILHGPVKPGMNRELIVSIFREVKLPQRVLDATALNGL